MYKYALINENNICHTIYESDIERTDFNCEFVEIDNYSSNYLNARYFKETNQWEFPPQPNFIWWEKYNLWGTINWEQNTKINFLRDIEEHLRSLYGDDSNLINSKLIELGFPSDLNFNNDNLEMSFLEKVASDLGIN